MVNVPTFREVRSGEERILTHEDTYCVDRSPTVYQVSPKGHDAGLHV